MKTIFLATGGTGGHIFPAKALGEELKKRGFNSVIISDERFLKYVDNNSANEIEYKILPVKQAIGGIVGKLKSGVSLVKSYFIARKLINKYKPVAAVGFGGYPSFPTMFAASQMGVKTIIHEQNSLLGKANEVLIKQIDALATSFPEVVGVAEKYKSKVTYVGNPVRSPIKAVRQIDAPEFSDAATLHILVTGGSQGAGVFSKIVPEAIKLLPEIYQKRIRIDQQSRAESIIYVQKTYFDLNISAEVATFFSDMPTRLSSTHLLIARSGASTLAEAAVAGRATIMVPLPNSKGNHQFINAKSFEASGGGILMEEKDFTPEALSKTLINFFEHPEKLNIMAKSAKLFGEPDADLRLADLVQDVLKG
jgi:UDP-N-acetylglucosamine--N-acetylmuramyl-(pentapeptide) pyrophosphoryl-undecaprenol N-acetylglucosamine transferase